MTSSRRWVEEPSQRQREFKEEGGGYQGWRRRRGEDIGPSYNGGWRGRGPRDDDCRMERFEEYSWAEEKPLRGKRREVSMRAILTMDGCREFKTETGRGTRRSR